jgi:hypothetical protein
MIVPAIFSVLTVLFGLDVWHSWRARIVQESGFVADREFDPKKAKILIAIKIVWLSFCLAGLLGSLLQAYG